MPPGQQVTREIAVIGASGFIGRNLVGQLLSRGDEVRALLRPGSARRSAIPAGAQQYESTLDPADKRLAAALKGVDAVVYAAGTVRGWSLDDFLAANVYGVRAVAAALGEAAPNAHLVLLSSLAASEADLSCYARSKRMGEEALAAAATPGLRWTILRPTAVYGPGDKELAPVFGMMRRGIVPCLGGPAQRLSFIHVDDVSGAIIAALDHPEAVASRCYSIDDGQPSGYTPQALAASLRPAGRSLYLSVPRSLLALAGVISLRVTHWLGRPPMLSPGKVRELSHPVWIGDNAVFTRATGWQPRYDLATGTRSLFAGS